MKKHLSIICVLMMLISFASCGDTPQNNSKPSNSSLEKVTKEETTEPSKKSKYYYCFSFVK